MHTCFVHVTSVTWERPERKLKPHPVLCEAVEFEKAPLLQTKNAPTSPVQVLFTLWVRGWPPHTHLTRLREAAGCLCVSVRVHVCVRVSVAVCLREYLCVCAHPSTGTSPLTPTLTPPSHMHIFRREHSFTSDDDLRCTNTEEAPSAPPPLWWDQSRHHASGPVSARLRHSPGGARPRLGGQRA